MTDAQQPAASGTENMPDHLREPTKKIGDTPAASGTDAMRSLIGYHGNKLAEEATIELDALIAEREDLRNAVGADYFETARDDLGASATPRDIASRAIELREAQLVHDLDEAKAARDAIIAERDRLNSGLAAMTADRNRPDLGDRAKSIQQLTDERDRMRAIVGRLPRTADGAPVYFGDTVWHPEHGEMWVDWDVIPGTGGAFGWMTYQTDGVKSDQPGACYSTRGAALAARKEAGDSI